MKTQMKFQKIMCLVMILAGALALVYAFVYCSGAMSELAQVILDGQVAGEKVSGFVAAEGKYDALLFLDIQNFNNALMWCGIVMILLAVLLYITASHSRRNYYISNYVAIGLCSVTDLVMSVILLAMNGVWRGKFLNVDFAAWKKYNEIYEVIGDTANVHYSESTLMFDIGFVVYILIIIASLFMIANLIWKIMLMKGEKQLLAESAVKGGASV